MSATQATTYDARDVEDIESRGWRVIPNTDAVRLALSVLREHAKAHGLRPVEMKLYCEGEDCSQTGYLDAEDDYGTTVYCLPGCEHANTESG